MNDTIRMTVDICGEVAIYRSVLRLPESGCKFPINKNAIGTVDIFCVSICRQIMLCGTKRYMGKRRFDTVLKKQMKRIMVLLKCNLSNEENSSGFFFCVVLEC